MNKTAMLELIQFIETTDVDLSKSEILLKAKSLLEKEKTELVSAWKSGKGSDYYETSDNYIKNRYANP